MTISFTPQFRQAVRGFSLALSLGLSLSLSLLGSIALTGSARADAPSCSAPGTGNPCAASAGNPINVITGNKFQQESDLPALPGVLGLEIVRYYNSDLSGPGIATGILGRGWKLSYEAELTLGARSIRLVEADGTVIDFGRDPLNPARARHSR